MELGGAHLAWIAQQVPAVKEGWPACLYQGGSWGQASVSYQTGFPGVDAFRDGPYYWRIRCDYLSPNPPPPPPPPPDPDDPPLTICDTQPWKCPDD